MNPLKDLLLAVDFTDHSRITLLSAISFCKENNSTLSLIHVIANTNKDIVSLTKNCEDKMDEIVKLVLRENIEVPHVNVKVSLADFENNVVAFAISIKANAIIVGSGNDHHNKKHRLGGHAEAILRDSSIPVLIIKDRLVPSKGQIACPLDFSAKSEIILKTAIDYAKHTGGELVVLHALEQPAFGYIHDQHDYLGTEKNNFQPQTANDYAKHSGGDLVMLHALEQPAFGYIHGQYNYLSTEKNYFQAQTVIMDDFLKTIDFKDIKWTTKILIGSPSQIVSEYINKFHFVMTVMSSASRIGISRLILGSVAEDIARNVDCPCLVIK